MYVAVCSRYIIYLKNIVNIPDAQEMYGFP